MDDFAVLAELGHSLTLAGSDRDARVLWEGLAELAPEAELPWRALAVMAARDGQWPSVLTLAAGALERGDTAAARLLHAEACVHTGQFAEAERDLERLLYLERQGQLADRARVILRRLRKP